MILRDDYVNGYMTSGSYFWYKGVRYGLGTKILFTEDFYKRVREYVNPHAITAGPAIRNGLKYPYFRKLQFIREIDGKIVWGFGNPLIAHQYTDVDPERDIEKIITPVWYLTPEEMIKKRLSDGTWIEQVWPHTLILIFGLLFSLLFREWYLAWIMGPFVYWREVKKELSKGELNNGW